MKSIGPCPFSWTVAAALILPALSLALGGCALEHSARNAPRPGRGLIEYSQLVERSRSAVDASLRSLDKVTTTVPCPSGVVAAFSDGVDRLSAESLDVRARSQAMQARGDAYFENWKENMAAMTDPRIREQAESHRSELQQSFGRIKSASQEARASFQSYLAGLRNLRSALEANPNALGDDSAKATARKTRQSGIEVEQKLDAMAAELNSMSLMLVPAGKPKP